MKKSKPTSATLVVRSPRAMARACRTRVMRGQTIALVPTMGYLHEGHLALVRRARQKADCVIVSIFVNPLQFGPKEDLAKYPRNLARDLALLRREKADFVFTPQGSSIYTPAFQTTVTVRDISLTLEGAIRPGHFAGVTTVVAILLNICRPDVVIFGQKDYQQAEVLRRMCADLSYPVSLVVAPTVRERSGLALSSRNTYFTVEQKREAACLYQGLRAARAAFRKGVRSLGTLEKIVSDTAQSACPTLTFDYIALTDRHNLTPLARAQSGSVLSLAARVHGVRLIDNVIL